LKVRCFYLSLLSLEEYRSKLTSTHSSSLDSQ
jgi:hypothetical protein